VGTRLLNLVIVAGDEVTTELTSWASLADPSLVGVVALPDPGFAGSAFAALGYFATADDLGMDFYQRLKDNGAVQVSSPGEVLDGVAEGRYAAGITLDNIARAAIEKGAPVRLIWPTPGAIALYSPAAVVSSSADPASAQAFVAFLISPAAQAAIAQTGWQPVRADVAWPYGGPTVAPDWALLFGHQADLLDRYRAIFGD
jgi:iron(III) transport system substrate-binding protein